MSKTLTVPNQNSDALLNYIQQSPLWNTTPNVPTQKQLTPNVKIYAFTKEGIYIDPYKEELVPLEELGADELKALAAVCAFYE